MFQSQSELNDDQPSDLAWFWSDAPLMRGDRLPAVEVLEYIKRMPKDERVRAIKYIEAGAFARINPEGLLSLIMPLDIEESAPGGRLQVSSESKELLQIDPPDLLANIISLEKFLDEPHHDSVMWSPEYLLQAMARTEKFARKGTLKLVRKKNRRGRKS